MLSYGTKFTSGFVVQSNMSKKLQFTCNTKLLSLSPKNKLQKDISFNSNDLCYHDFQELSLKTCRGHRTLHQGWQVVKMR